MILALFALYFGYKKAKATGRNPFLWAFIAAAVFVGTQWGVAVAVYAGFTIGIAGFGWSETVIDDYQLLVNIISIAASVVSLLLVFRYLDKIPEEETVVEPPPPPSFGGENLS